MSNIIQALPYDGTPMSWEVLYETLRRPLISFVKELIGSISTQEAEDIVSDVFTDSIKVDPHLTKIKTPKAYLFTAVKNACYKFTRKRRITTHLIEELTNQSPKSDQLLSDLIEEFISVGEYVEKSINTLPPKEQEIGRKAFQQGKGNAEIARELNWTENSVKSQKSKIIKKLKKDNHFPPEGLYFLHALMFYLFAQ